MFSHYLENILYGGLGIWFCLSAVGQIRVFALTRRLAALGVIPRWNFFAPTPGTLDVRLFYRHRSPNGTVGTWTELELPDRTRLGFIWNPTRRLRKILFDASQELISTIIKSEKQQGILTVPYLTILGVVTNAPHPPTAAFIQFALVAQQHLGGKEIGELFRSKFHDL